MLIEEEILVHTYSILLLSYAAFPTILSQILGLRILLPIQEYGARGLRCVFLEYCTNIYSQYNFYFNVHRLPTATSKLYMPVSC